MNKPKLYYPGLIKLIKPLALDTEKYPVYIVGIRGYYKNSMGSAGVNDRGIYDDALFIVSGNKSYPFNGNVDPASYRKGYGFAEQKGMASTKPGLYYCLKLDYHKGKYLALCQRLGPITVIRDGNPPYEHTSKYIGANNHKGGISTTNSLACWTVVPSQWDEYINLVVSEMKMHYGEITTGKFDALNRPIYKDIIIPNILIEF